ncbi:MAG: glycerophosphodiester phosphodiesterase [Gammaproteobacteria bacterium]|nr:glycerophosphodiester phosphodiesterase [Gammaproteobacteria bacterium]
MHYSEKLIDLCFASWPRSAPHLTSFNLPHLIAHRGAHDKASFIQENTHHAFERALNLGCYGIELDIHATADGVVVVNHDR